jgi:hypothetical protein
MTVVRCSQTDPERASLSVMRVVGEGSNLWRVEVVLWVHEPDVKTVAQLLDVVASVSSHVDEDQPGVRDVDRAWSYDIQPPEGGVGVALWGRSGTVGSAAETGWTVVRDAATSTLGEVPRLWDLRVIPRAAIAAAPYSGTPLTGG